MSFNKCVLLVTGLLFATTVASWQPGWSTPNPDWDAAVKLYSQKKYSEALIHFRAAAKYGYEPASAYYYEGLCYQALGNLKQAILLYRQVYQQYPGTEAAIQSALALSRLTGPPSAVVRPPLPPFYGRPDGSQTQPLFHEVLVPFRRENGNIMVNALINGQSQVAVFDLGTARCVLNADMGGGQMVSIELGGIRKYLQTGSPDQARGVGGIAAPNSLPYPLIGQEFLAGMTYRIDEAEKVIQIKFAPN